MRHFNSCFLFVVVLVFDQEGEVSNGLSLVYLVISIVVKLIKSMGITHKMSTLGIVLPELGFVAHFNTNLSLLFSQMKYLFLM